MTLILNKCSTERQDTVLLYHCDTNIDSIRHGKSLIMLFMFDYSSVEKQFLELIQIKTLQG